MYVWMHKIQPLRTIQNSFPLTNQVTGRSILVLSSTYIIKIINNNKTTSRQNHCTLQTTFLPKSVSPPHPSFDHLKSIPISSSVHDSYRQHYNHLWSAKTVGVYVKRFIQIILCHLYGQGSGMEDSCNKRRSKQETSGTSAGANDTR